MKLKYLYTILLVFAFISVSGQTDEEIGYNEQELRVMFLADGIDAANIDKQLVLQRKALVETYKAKLSGAKAPKSSNTACGNIGFQEDFDEWTYERGKRTINPQGVVEVDYITHEYNDIIDDSGSIVLSSPYINAYIPDSQITANDLNLHKFGANAIRLGRNNFGAWAERITKTIDLTEENRLFSYNYAVVLEEPTNTGHTYKSSLLLTYL